MRHFHFSIYFNLLLWSLGTNYTYAALLSPYEKPSSAALKRTSIDSVVVIPERIRAMHSSSFNVPSRIPPVSASAKSAAVAALPETRGVEDHSASTGAAAQDSWSATETRRTYAAEEVEASYDVAAAAPKRPRAASSRSAGKPNYGLSSKRTRKKPRMDMSQWAESAKEVYLEGAKKCKKPEYPASQYQFGCNFMWGLNNFPKDEALALEWWTLSAKHGNEFACRSLETFYAEKHQRLCNEAMAYAAQGNMPMAFERWHAAADGGNIHSMVQLSQAYRALGNISLAEAWLMQARSVAPVAFQIGQAHMKLGGIQTTLYYWANAAAIGFPYAAYYLGNMLYGLHDINKAIYCWELGASHGCPYSAQALSYILPQQVPGAAEIVPDRAGERIL